MGALSVSCFSGVAQQGTVKHLCGSCAGLKDRVREDAMA